MKSKNLRQLLDQFDQKSSDFEKLGIEQIKSLKGGNAGCTKNKCGGAAHLAPTTK